MKKLRERFAERADSVSQKTKIDKKLFPIIALAVIGIALLLISELPFAEKKASEKESSTASPGFSSSEYIKELESKITSIVSSIDGAGKTKVMITLESSLEEIYLRDSNYSSDSDTKSGISSKEENKYIIISGESGEGGIVSKTVEPKVRGVAVVCEGAASSRVKQEIIDAVSALLNVSSARISVAQMSQ